VVRNTTPERQKYKRNQHFPGIESAQSAISFEITKCDLKAPISADPRQYIKKMRSRDSALNANWGTTCIPLALMAPDGKLRKTQRLYVKDTRGIRSSPAWNLAKA
jgi:hypothetical protein